MEFASMVLVVLLSQRVHVVDSPAINDRPIGSPEVLYYTDPFYTRTAREKKIEGTVTIEATFDVRGCMKVLRTVKTVGFGLDENAVTALRSWRFSPAKRNGEPVEAIAQIDVDFSLAAAPPIEYDDINTQIERFFRACGISCGEAPLFSVSGFVADLLEAIPQSQSRVIGHRAHGRYEQAFSTLSATRVLKSDDRILQRSG